jgi:hypothetical protein
MGLVQDSFVLASSGYSKTSGALSLINKMGGETENLVCGFFITFATRRDGTDSVRWYRGRDHISAWEARYDLVGSVGRRPRGYQQVP